MTYDMTTTNTPNRKRERMSLHQRRRMFEVAVLVFFLVYALFTLFPFYGLFVRTFVSTKNSTDLHLWLPEAEDIDLDAQVGNLSTHFDLDLQKFKIDMGIPITDYLSARTSLHQIAAEYNIPEQEMIDYFGPFSLYNGWISLLGSGDFWPAVARTALITIVALVGLNVLSVCTGYGLAGLTRKDQALWYSLYLLRAVIPPMLIILPQFVLVQWILNRVPGFENPGAVRNIGQLTSVMLIWMRGGALPSMLMLAAIESIPKELEEAAEIDGANPLQYFWHVLLPLMKVPMASLTVIFLPLIWNDFINPFIYLDQANTTILPLIQSYSGQYASNFQVIYTGVFMSILPLIFIYILFRRWFVEGAMAGAIKG